MVGLGFLFCFCRVFKLVKLTKVIQHEEYARLPKDEVLQYFEKCKNYLGIRSDDFLLAGLKWVSSNGAMSGVC